MSCELVKGPVNYVLITKTNYQIIERNILLTFSAICSPAGHQIKLSSWNHHPGLYGILEIETQTQTCVFNLSYCYKYFTVCFVMDCHFVHWTSYNRDCLKYCQIIVQPMNHLVQLSPDHTKA